MHEKTRTPSRAFLIVLVLLSFCLVSRAARAQSDRRWEIGAFAGFQTFADGNRLSIPDDVSTSALQLPKERSLLGGIRLSFAPITFAAAELEVGQSTTSFSNTNVNVQTLLYRLQILINLTGSTSAIKAFVVGGIGGIRGTPSQALVMLQQGGQNFEFSTSTETDFETHLGGGVKYQLGEALGGRADLRFRWPSSSAESQRREIEGLLTIYVRF